MCGVLIFCQIFLIRSDMSAVSVTSGKVVFKSDSFLPKALEQLIGKVVTYLKLWTHWSNDQSLLIQTLKHKKLTVWDRGTLSVLFSRRGNYAMLKQTDTQYLPTLIKVINAVGQGGRINDDLKNVFQRECSVKIQMATDCAC